MTDLLPLHQVQPMSIDKFEASLGEGEVAVYLPTAGHPLPALVQTWLDQANKTLTLDHEYLRSTLHMTSKGHPVIVATWQQADRNPLEMRWLLNKVRDRIKQLSSAKKIVVYLDQFAGTRELVMAEDFFFAQLDASEPRTLWQTFKLWTHPQLNLAAIDPRRQERLDHHFAFRHWINQNPDELTSIEIGNRLANFAKTYQCSFRAIEREELKTLGLNLLVAVGQASDLSPSRLLLLTNNVKGPAPLLLVGKGITFDTGGINVKPFEGFVNCMKNDMGGAALMANLFMALVRSGYDKPLVLAIPACENLVGERAMKPGVVVRSHRGLRVVVEHTDAEGRLILADAISYANQLYKPRFTFVAATLTTAVLRQFTNYFTAAHFLPDDLQPKLHAAGRNWGERFSCWEEFLPFQEGNKSAWADLTNMGRLPSHANIGGGSNVAAHFLKQFSDSPLVHFDIFGSTWNWSNDYPGTRAGATGAPFNSLLEFLAGL